MTLRGEQPFHQRRGAAVSGEEFRPESSGGNRASNTSTPTTVAARPTTDPVVTGTVNPNGGVSERTLSYLPISQFDAREYAGGALPGFEERASEATVLTMIARALAGERANTLFIDNFWDARANDNTGAAEFALIAQRVRFSNGQDKKVDPEKAEPFPLAGADPAKLLQGGPLMISGRTGNNGTQTWMLAIRMTDDGKGIVANDPLTGKQVILAYDPDTKTIGGVTSVLDPKTNAFIAIKDAEALKVAGLGDINPDRATSLQSFAPTSYSAVGVN